MHDKVDIYIWFSCIIGYFVNRFIVKSIIHLGNLICKEISR